jgi:hypothetical protein
MSSDSAAPVHAPTWPADDNAPMFVPPGHFYSPIPDLAEVRARETSIYRVPDALPGIDLRSRDQLEARDGRPRWHSTSSTDTCRAVCLACHLVQPISSRDPS